jgi:hypothetical protein
MGGNSSFYYTNPTPEVVQGLSAQLVAATNAATAATAAANNQLAAYTVVTKPWASTVAINWNDANCQRVTLGGSTTFTFTGGVDGEKLILELKQDATGSRLITLPSNVRFSSTIPSILLSTDAGRIDKLGFMFNSTDSKYDLVAVSYGFF